MKFNVAVGADALELPLPPQAGSSSGTTRSPIARDARYPGMATRRLSVNGFTMLDKRLVICHEIYRL